MPTDVLQDVTVCESNPPLLNAGNAGCAYLWNTGAATQSIVGTSTNLYTVTVTTAQNCAATFDVQVTLAPAITVDLGNDTTICSGTSIPLDAGTPGSTYAWSTGATSQTISASSANIYSVTVNNGYCTATDAIAVNVAQGPMDVLQDVSRCIDSPPTLDAGNAGCTYLWGNGATSQTIVANTSGNYPVTVTNSVGCSAAFDANVTLVQPPVIELGPDTVLCEGRILTLDAGNPGCSYNWSNGAHTRTISVGQAGVYTVEVTNGQCERTDNIHVQFNPSPARMAVNEFHTCLDDEPKYVVIDAGNAGAQHQWSTGETTQVIMASA
ncbi:MAG TPA: hypothetical protein PK760_16710, partial [Flavobacteriales bacterium]|nr:hypothetical protein [Flavobacteriales bacterium]